MRHLLITAAAIALTAGTAYAQEATPTPANPAEAGAVVRANTTSNAFIAEASTSMVWLREASELAQNRAQSDEIRLFADDLRSDMADAIDTLLEAVDEVGMAAAVPQNTSEAQNAAYSQLEDATAAEFDGIYIGNTLATLNELSDLVTAYADTGEETDELQDFADDASPMIEDYRQRAAELAATYQMADGPVTEGVVGDDAAVADAAPAAEAGNANVVAEGDARIVVEQPAPEIRLEQGETRVFVEQPAPEVTVTQNPPEIVVFQPAPVIRIEIPTPQVQVDMPEPVITVRVPDPDFAFNLQDPQIRIEQEPPRVEVIQAEPNVAVEVDPAAEADANVNTEAPAPIVEMGQRPEPVVNMQRAEPNVQYDADEPRVEFAEVPPPNVQINRIGEQNVQVERPEGDDAAAADMQLRNVVGMPPVEGAGAVDQMTVEELKDLNLINDEGETLGDVEQVVELGDRRYIIIGHGGFLGLGEREVAIPLDAIYFNGEDLVFPGLTAEQIEQTDEVDLDDFEVLEDDIETDVNM